jgi:hypothetical protein
LFFLVPAALIVVAIEKLAEILRPVADKTTDLLGPFGIGPETTDGAPPRDGGPTIV